MTQPTIAKCRSQKHVQPQLRFLGLNIACDRYWLEIGQYHVRPDQTEWSLRWLILALGADKTIASITDSDVAAIVAKRRGEAVTNRAAETGRKKRRRHERPVGRVSASTVNRSVTEPLRKVLNRARDAWGQEVARINWKVHLLKEPRERVRSLSDEEEERLFASLPSQYHPIVRFALRTGCRISECINLKWSAVDWGARRLTILGKGDKLAPIPMSNDVRELLWAQRGRHEERVFTYAGGRPMTLSGLDTAWGRALAKASISDFRFHDLRHTAATRLLKSSGNLKMAQKLLRHENIATTAKYAHVFDEDLRTALDAMVAQSPDISPDLGMTIKK